MVLAFRARDYERIIDMAIMVEKDIPIVITEACEIIGRDANFYTNPASIDDYQRVEVLDLDIDLSVFEMMVEKANFHNYTVEEFVIEAIKFYESVIELERGMLSVS